MKKTILIAFAFSLISANAFAQDFTSAGGIGDGVLAGFKASKQVIVTCFAAEQVYAAGADHLNGTRVFAVASGDPLIYFREKTDAEIGTNAAATDITSSDSATFVGAAGWSSL